MGASPSKGNEKSRPGLPPKGAPAQTKKMGNSNAPKKDNNPVKAKSRQHPVENYKSRLIRFYKQYSPKMLEKVESLLEQWKGKEDALFEQLAMKYGPEPTVDRATPAPRRKSSAVDPNEKTEVATPATNPWEGRLARHLLAYKPEKLSEISSTLTRAMGKEAQVLLKLIQQTGPEPEGPLPCGTCDDPLPGTQVKQTPEVTEPVRKVPADIQPEAEVTHARKDKLSDASPLNAVIEAEKPPLNSHLDTSTQVKPIRHSLRRRLSIYFGLRAPKKLQTLDECIRRYGDNEGELFAFLHEKYGPDPTEDEARAYFVDRLEALYKNLYGSCVTDVKAEIDACYGAEEEYLQSVEAAGELEKQKREEQRKVMDLLTYAPPAKVASVPNIQECANSQSEYCNDKTFKKDVPRREDSVPAIKHNELPLTSYEKENDVFNSHAGKSATTSNMVSGSVLQMVDEHERQLSQLQAAVQRLSFTVSEEPPPNASRSTRHSMPQIRNKNEPLLNILPLADSQYRYNPRNSVFNSTTFNAVDDFLPPPSLSKYPRHSLPSPQVVYDPSTYVSKQKNPLGRQVRTLAEMRVEYEREREAIRSSEKRLDHYSSRTWL